MECGQPVVSKDSPGSGDRYNRSVAPAALEGERKFVTVLFADLKGSMELVADRDPEEARTLLDPVLEHMCEAVEQYGGTVSQVMGDGIMALFGAPIAAEDHAVRAARAALTMQDLVRHYGDEIQRTHGVPIQIRVGLNSGETVLRLSEHGLHTSYTAIGVNVHLAARMEQLARPGSILATAETARLAGDHVEARFIGPLNVKGFDRLIEVAEIRRAKVLRSRFDAASTRSITPFVGRDRELQRMLAAFDHLAAGTDDDRGRVLVIVGDPGIGKSRLVYEFMRTLARRNVLTLDGGSAPYGSGAGYRPGTRILRQYFNIGDDDDAGAIREKVAGGVVALAGDMGNIVAPVLSILHALPTEHAFHQLPDKERRQQVVDALLWLNRRVASERPLVLAYEDLQWVTSDTRKFLARLVSDVPRWTLLVLTHRSDYDAPEYAIDNVAQLKLDGLAHSLSRNLISELLGDDESLDPLKDELAERSGGNPLFIEEHVRSLIQSGALVGEPQRYQLVEERDVSAIPPTVRAVLAARIDRLSLDDKHVLQALAAIGDLASVTVLAKVAEMPAEDLRKSLRRLQTTGLLIARADREQLAYEFKHSLTQTVAYETLLHERRRELHLRIMQALDAEAPAEVLARHAVLGEAWSEALVYLREAGRQAAQQFAEVEAIACYERALLVIKRLPPEQRSQAIAIDLHLEMRNALVPLGQHRRLIEVLRSAQELAEATGDEHRMARVAAFMSNYYGNVGLTRRALQAAERALALGEKLGDPEIEIMAALSAGEIHRTLGDYPRAKVFLSRVVGMIGPTDLQRTHGQVGLPSVRARSHLAWTLSELGEFDRARAIAEEGIHIADSFGHGYSLSHACLGLGGTRVRQGEFEAAVSILRRGLSVSDRVPLLRPPIEADLGLALAHSGQLVDGVSHVHAAVDAASSMGRLSRLALMLVKSAEVHVLAGDAPRARALAEQALGLATEQEERGNVAYAHEALAAIASVEANEPEAIDRFEQAITLAETLDMAALAARCRAGLGTLHLRAGNESRARSALVQARAQFRDMGMRYWLAKLDADLAVMAAAGP
jgi:class 3 adenylate cyclase/tetratricopeptide (TPR) repeat protein